MSLANAVGGSVTRTIPTQIGLLIDKSGSMYSYQEVVQNSLSQLVKDQQQIKDMYKPSLTLSEFNEGYNKVFEMKINDIKDLNSIYKYSVDGGTCITQSIFDITRDMENSIKQTGQKVKKVIIGVITDGQNGCYRVTNDDVKNLIERKKLEGWEYLFFGPDEQSMQAAAEMGFAKEKSAAFGIGNSINLNVQGALKLLSDKISEVRKGKPLQITDGEKANLLTLPSGKEL